MGTVGLTIVHMGTVGVAIVHMGTVGVEIVFYGNWRPSCNDAMAHQRCSCDQGVLCLLFLARVVGWTRCGSVASS